MAQIPSISSGQLIDQNILSTLIDTVNSISNNQYSSVSSIGNAGVTDVNAYTSLKNGEWIVNTGYVSVDGVPVAANDFSNMEFTATFKQPFNKTPIVTATAFSSATAQVIQTNVIHSIVVTYVSTTGFTFKILTYGKTKGTTNFGVMYTAVGPSTI